ncbi:MAG: glycosyltransferase family 2 protein [Betaproteobacteria bacterium]
MSPTLPVSLVIPAYNRADFVAETLDSALNQTQPFDEIIVIDDGSTDATPEVLTRYAGRIRSRRTANHGVQSARNTGVDMARNPLVAFCDSDDLLEPDLVQVIAPWMSAHPESDAVYCDFVTFNHQGTDPTKFSRAPAGFFDGAADDGDFLTGIPDLYGRSVDYQPLFQSGLTVRKEFFERIGGFDTKFKGVGAEDWEFTLRALALGNIALCKRPLARVRKHEGNDSGDAMKMSLGEAQILEHGLSHHPGARRYEEAIHRSIAARRASAFDAAFARGDFDLAGRLLELLPPRHDPRFRLKSFIATLPAALRSPLWRLTQR